MGVKYDQKTKMIKVDHNSKTNISNIWAIGDCVPGPMLAHKASEEGIAAVENMKFGGGHFNHETIPGVIYTNPEVAYVGKNEQ